MMVGSYTAMVILTLHSHRPENLRNVTKKVPTPKLCLRLLWVLTDYFYGRCRLVSIYSQFTLSAVVELELHYNSLTTETSTFQKMQIFQGKRSLLMVCATHFTASSKQTAGDQGNLLKSKAVAGLWCSTVNFSVTSFCANSNHLGNTSFSVATGGCQRVSSPV